MVRYRLDKIGNKRYILTLGTKYIGIRKGTPEQIRKRLGVKTIKRI